MPSSPKSFAASHTRHPFATRRSTLFLLLSALLLLLLGIAALAAQIRASRCVPAPPRSVRVVWEHAGSGATGGGGDGDRHKVMGFVGIQTGFGSTRRREALRKTWFPSDRQGLQRLEDATGLAFRFIIGRTSDRSKMSALQKEIAEYDDFIQLDIQEEYSKLPYKTLAFFKAAYALFDAEFYVKADDDIYLRPDRLSLLLAKERSHPQTYIGCMKKGPVFTDPKLKWYEPLSYLLGKEYFLHAYGPIYVLSADVVSSLVALRNDSFRMFSNEDVTIGAWMLAMNVNHENNHELCATDCTATSIAVWDLPKCSGLCNPEKKMLELHQKETCSKSPTLESDDE
ncbi:probable beta-1,3-galactosyltransferase 14 [Cajanus cajan]|uniref:Hexosyltransferase n=1 Tax=Cajanus cajan TaxID=3821 RepID=A0A151RI08_CAJCA|nr:probable beta-1,3-galactosyltransferase 14 [Cajanus cajan]KYP42055.1 putative beta-1,3-galactosyltransferase 14 [Cajanus cajan]